MFFVMNGFLDTFHNFLNIRHLRLMTFATVLWIRKLTYDLSYRFEI